jgi:mycothiol synthase
MPQTPTGVPRLQLHMVVSAERLARPPVWTLPEGYALRCFREGDNAEYVRLMAAAGFEGWNDEKIADLQMRVLPNGFFVIEHLAKRRLVATATAQHRPIKPFRYGGELGWVAGDPKHRGKGLGLAVCAAVVKRLIDAGYFNVFLLTDDFRLAAIRIYFKLGFVPALITPDMDDRWRTVCAQLGTDFNKLNSRKFPA